MLSTIRITQKLIKTELIPKKRYTSTRRDYSIISSKFKRDHTLVKMIAKSISRLKGLRQR